jgi:7,8-dihydropterin-6-yl-methyl-4-(beta-D-ribofuranosyl)aminobenzene 5'-phosphate synthase
MLPLAILLAAQPARADAGDRSPRAAGLRLTVTFNNVVGRPARAAGLKTAWGFSCLVETPQRSVLFDTGSDGPTLLSNLHRLGLPPESIDAVFISHLHRDHTGGLGDLLSRRAGLTVYLPASAPARFRKTLADQGAQTVPIAGPQALGDGMYSTGEIGTYVAEQAMLIDTPRGLIVITGCAHPGVDTVVEQAVRQLGKPVRLLMGGFHLMDRSPDQVRAVIARLQRLGVEEVAPSHCTGDSATELFREAWDQHFVDGGLGALIVVEP